MGEVICADLEFEIVFGFGEGAGHHACVVDARRVFLAGLEEIVRLE